jgi:hypothetical protein
MFAIASLVTLALAASASAYSVSTPDKLELCKDAKYTISGASATDTFTAYFVHGDNPCGDEIFHMEVTGTEFTWKVNATEGTSIMVALDNGSDEQWSGAVTVTGSDTSCLSSSSASRSSASVSGSTTRAGSTYTAPVNAASSAPSATDANVPNSGSRAAFGITSALAVLGAAVVGISL